jgi:GAF domain-containing protein
MASSRSRRLLGVLTRQPEGDLASRVCSAAAEVLTCPGVGLSLGSADALLPVAATVDGREGERLQADLGEGPCYDAWRSGAIVAGPDLAAASPWPILGPALLRTGKRAVFAFPIAWGGVQLGALTAYRSTPGRLSDTQEADGLALAGLAGGLLVDLQDEPSEDDPPNLAADPGEGSWIVHQASGMTAVQLDLPLADAMARLRAHAYVVDQPLETIAAEIFARRLRLDET